MQVHSFFLLVALLVVPFCTSMSCYDKSPFLADSTKLKINNADHDYAYNKVASCATLTTEKNSEVCCYIKLKFKNHQYDILLGTQMVAKGLDFSNVTLVGVINADTSLFIPSYKSNENTFDLLNQVAGRSGRSEKTGDVIVQTYNPDNFSIQCAKKQDYNRR